MARLLALFVGRGVYYIVGIAALVLMGGSLRVAWNNSVDAKIARADVAILADKLEKSNALLLAERENAANWVLKRDENDEAISNYWHNVQPSCDDAGMFFFPE